MQRILLTTGGTGGHIFPALAVAEVLQKQGVQLLFVGSQYGPEASLCHKAGVAFQGLAVRGILGRGFAAVGASFAMLQAVVKAIEIIKNFKPDAVVGFGGYASFAPVFAAKLCRVPIAIHEQNAVSGVSNKVLGKLATKIFLSMNAHQGQGFASEKCVHTGNPVREALAELGEHTLHGARAHDFSGKRLLIVGGSQGAKAINSIVIEHLDAFKNAGVQLWHQTGKADFARVHAAYTAAGMPTEHEHGLLVADFVHNMDAAYAWSDLVLCRSGASTVAELAAAGRGAVFVPFPYATHNHQWHNAQLLAAHNAARVFDEKHLQSAEDRGQFVRNIIELIQDAHTVQAMALASLAQAKVQAAHDIAKHVHGLIKK